MWLDIFSQESTSEKNKEPQTMLTTNREIHLPSKWNTLNKILEKKTKFTILQILQILIVHVCMTIISLSHDLQVHPHTSYKYLKGFITYQSVVFTMCTFKCKVANINKTQSNRFRVGMYAYKVKANYCIIILIITYFTVGLPGEVGFTYMYCTCTYTCMCTCCTCTCM